MAIGGQVVIRPMMYLALSYDHRVVDGQGAVTFLVHVKEAQVVPAVAAAREQAGNARRSGPVCIRVRKGRRGGQCTLDSFAMRSKSEESTPGGALRVKTFNPQEKQKAFNRKDRRE